MDTNESYSITDSSHSEQRANYDHDQSGRNRAALSSRKHLDAAYQTNGSPSPNAKALKDADTELEKEDEEEDEEVEGAVISESFVKRPIPTDKGTRSEEETIQNR